MAPKDTRNLSEDPIVSALVPDPGQGPPNATVLEGYLGKSTDAGRWRLYLTPQLDQWVELEDGDILHSEKLADEQGSRVWVRQGVELTHVQANAQRVQAEFLAGPIAGAAAAGPTAPVTPQPITQTLATTCTQIRCPTIGACPSVFVAQCPTFTRPCASQLIIRCPTTPLGGCPPQTVRPPCPLPTTQFTGCPSGIVPCVSAPVRCPSVLDGCPSSLRCPSEVVCPSDIRCPSFGFCPSPICGGGGVDPFDPGTLGF
jgi:hypothetical protein